MRRRDPRLERVVLERIAGYASGRFGVDADGFPDAVEQHLLAGGHWYDQVGPDDGHLHELRDNVLGVGGLAVISLQAHRRAPTQLRRDLRRVLILTVAVDAHARAALRHARDRAGT
jgi:hypothetical protein